MFYRGVQLGPRVAYKDVVRPIINPEGVGRRVNKTHPQDSLSKNKQLTLAVGYNEWVNF